jgi:aryl-alcohol dehydrogenase-like predicted oxidoreductase
MEYRLLGRSGLKVSRLALGALSFGRRDPSSPFSSVPLADAQRQVDICLDAGVNIIDTANVYGAGESEELVGKTIAGKRDRLVVATKARANVIGGPNDAGNSRINLIAECERSLKRLQTDWIDLYQLHHWDGETPLDETMEALDSLVRAGKVRYVGCSNFSAWHLMKAMGVAERRNFVPFVSQQIYYSAHGREAEYELVPLSIDQGIGILVWSPLAGGLISGKFRRGGSGPEGSRHFGRSWREPPVYDEDRLYDLIETLVSIGEARGISAARVAIAWLLTRPAVTSVIIGARSRDQLADNLAAADLVLGAEEIARIEAAGRPPLIYPYWHQALNASDRLSAGDLSLLEREVPNWIPGWKHG